MARYAVIAVSLFFCLVNPAWAADEWEHISDSGPPRFGATGNVVRDNIDWDRALLVIPDGVTPDGQFGEGIHAFDLRSEAWHESEYFEENWERVWAATAVVDNKILRFGGQNPDGFEGFSTYDEISLESHGGILRAYLERKASSGVRPPSRDLFEVVYHRGTNLIYGFGGRGEDGQIRKDAFWFNPSTGEFGDVAPMPRELASYGAAVMGGKIVIAFGLTYDSDNHVAVSDQLFAYDVYNDSYEVKNPGGEVPDPPYRPGVVTLDHDNILVTGGFNRDNTPLKQALIYTASTNRFSRGEDLTQGVGDSVIDVVPKSATSGPFVEVLIHSGDEGGVVSEATLRYISEVPFGPDQFLAAAASASGVGGRQFTTRGNIINVGRVAVDVNWIFKNRKGSGDEILNAEMTLQPYTVFESDNLLLDIFGVTEDRVGSAALEIRGGNPDDVFGNTTITASGETGEYGQAFPLQRYFEHSFKSFGASGNSMGGQPAGESSGDLGDDRPTDPLKQASQAGQTAYLFTTEDPEHNRVNVGGMAVGPTELSVTPELPLGHPLAPPRSIELATLESFQINNVYNEFGLGVPNAIIAVEVVSGVLVPFASVLDGNGPYAGTSDPTTIWPVARPGSNQTFLLEIGSITGQGGTQFKGSASILNFDEETAMVRADFFRRGSPGVSTSATLSVPGGGVLGFSDFASEVLGVEGDVGTVRFTTDGSGIAVTGREYSVEVDGGGNVIGTAGQLMRGLTEEDLLEPEQTCHGIGLREGGGERSHIAFFNPGMSSATVEVSLFNGADGAFEGDGSFTVPGQTLEQFNNIIRLINPNHDGDQKRIEVTMTQPVYGALFRVNPWADPVTFDFFCRE